MVWIGISQARVVNTGSCDPVFKCITREIHNPTGGQNSGPVDMVISLDIQLSTEF